MQSCGCSAGWPRLGLGLLCGAEVDRLQRKLAAEERARRLAEQQLAERELQARSPTQRAEEEEEELDRGLLESIELSSGAEERAAALCALRARLSALHMQLQEERCSGAALQEALCRSERELQERPRPAEQAGFKQMDIGSIIAKEREVCQLQQMVTEELSRRNELQHRLEFYECRQPSTGSAAPGGAWFAPQPWDAAPRSASVCVARAPSRDPAAPGGHQTPLRQGTPVRFGGAARPRPLSPARPEVPFIGPPVTPQLSAPAVDSPPFASMRKLASARSMPFFHTHPSQHVLYAQSGGGRRPSGAALEGGDGGGTLAPRPSAGTKTLTRRGSHAGITALHWPSSYQTPLAPEEKAVDAVKATSIASPHRGGAAPQVPGSPDKPPGKSQVAAAQVAPWRFNGA